MGNIVTLPLPPAGVRAAAIATQRAAAQPPTNSIITFAEVIARLGWDGEGVQPRQLVDRLRTLHDRAGLPAPRGLRLWGRRIASGSAAITARSHWDRFEFLRWYDNSRPSGPAAASVTPPRMACLNATARRVAGGAA